MGWKLVKTDDIGNDVITDYEMESLKLLLRCSSFVKHYDLHDKIQKLTVKDDIQNWENEGGAMP